MELSNVVREWTTILRQCDIEHNYIATFIYMERELRFIEAARNVAVCPFTRYTCARQFSTNVPFE